MLSTPEAQKDPHYWASVFAGHCVVGLILWAIFGSVYYIALLYWLLWEAAQIVIYKADPWDSALDWTGVVIGALCAQALWQQDRWMIAATIVSGLVIAAVGSLVRSR